MLAFAGANSFATGTATIGIFFVTENAFAFSAETNFWLGVLVGVTYIAGALGAGRLQRALARRSLSGRSFLALLTCVLGLASLVPWLFPHPATVFGVLAVYAPTTGVFWPLVESYVSGGRRGAELRTAVGRFNVVWSATLALAFWAMTFWMERSALAIFPLIAAVNAVSLVCLPGFRPQPGEHAAGEPHAYPQSYVALLRVHRVLHATAYLVMYALAPLLPALTRELGLPPARATAVASTWMFARVATFFVLERWHAWHGRWSVPVLGALAGLGGFALAVLAPALAELASRPAALAAFVAGLFVFGAGLAALYTAALYYVMEVGGGEVDAGGSHEALIGIGYTVGPLCGVFSCALVRTGWIAPDQREGALLLAVAALSLAAGSWAWTSRGRTRHG